MTNIAELTINTLTTEPQKIAWVHQPEWARYGYGELWNEHSDAAAELVEDDARAAYESALEHYEEVAELARGTTDAKLRFYVRTARTAANDARRRLHAIRDGAE